MVPSDWSRQPTSPKTATKFGSAALIAAKLLFLTSILSSRKASIASKHEARVFWTHRKAEPFLVPLTRRLELHCRPTPAILRFAFFCHSPLACPQQPVSLALVPTAFPARIDSITDCLQPPTAV
jgi:hypothetical protein